MAHIVIYSANPCPYCVQVKRFLNSLGLTFEERDITNDAAKWQELEQATSGWRTVPMIFIDSTFIGGHLEVQQLHREGRLLPMVRP
jgi:glutaredoxin 3